MGPGWGSREAQALRRPGSVFPSPRRRVFSGALGAEWGMPGLLTFLPSPSDEGAGAHGEFVPTKREGAEPPNGAGRKAQAGQLL